MVLTLGELQKRYVYNSSVLKEVKEIYKGSTKIRPTIPVPYPLSQYSLKRTLQIGYFQYADISGDGRYLFIYTSGSIKRYDMATPWDISTIGSPSQTLSVSSVYGIGLSFGGEYICYSQSSPRGRQLHKRKLSTPFDLNSIGGDWYLQRQTYQIATTRDGLGIIVRVESGNSRQLGYYLHLLNSVDDILPTGTYGITSSTPFEYPGGMYIDTNNSKIYVAFSGAVTSFALSDLKPTGGIIESISTPNTGLCLMFSGDCTKFRVQGNDYASLLEYSI